LLILAGEVVFTDRRPDTRLHEDDLVGYVLAQEPWEVVSFPAIAEVDEAHRIETIWEPRCFTRARGEALHDDDDGATAR
jgi:hypothetical protein